MIIEGTVINLGSPVLVCPEAAAAAQDGTRMRVNAGTGRIEWSGRRFSAQPFPPFLEALIRAGWYRGFGRSWAGGDDDTSRVGG